jgi:hypothetical protein
MFGNKQRKLWFLAATFLLLAFAPLRSGAFSILRPTLVGTRLLHATSFMSTASPTSNQTTEISSVNTIQEDTYQTNLQISNLATLAPQNSSAADAALQLLQKLPHPDTVTYNGVLKAFAKSPSLKGAQKAQDLLEKMEREHYQQKALKEQNDDFPVLITPNVRTYSTVMDAWSRRSGKVPNAAEHANDILEKLESLYEETGDSNFQPNTISYNTVIAAYAKDGGQANEALALLKKMGPLADVISYNAVLLAFARSGLPDAGERAEALLREMQTVNARSYTTVIDAWSRSNAEDKAERAYSLLQEMEDAYEKTQDLKIRPNCISYSTVINAYALSKDPRKAQKSWNILKRMRQLSDSGKNTHAAPSLITYNSVLNACATSVPIAQLQIKQMVHSLYTEIMDSPDLQADHFTYGTGAYVFVWDCDCVESLPLTFDLTLALISQFSRHVPMFFVEKREMMSL